MFDGQGPPEARQRAHSPRIALLTQLSEKILEPADIRLNGSRPWDIRIHDWRALSRALLKGSIGFGEGYVEGLWSSDDLEELAYRLALGAIDDAARWLPEALLLKLASRVQNR